jgi:pyruvate carboxylase subunit B
MHQIPGGMFTNLVSQLREADALDRIKEVYEELPRTRKELGYPPLVTPTSQIVGIQAVQNVLFGRYKMVSREVKDYVYGLYGRSPAPIDPKVQKIVLKGYERGEKPIIGRAVDILEPELDKAKEATKDIARDIGDTLIYALYPTTGMRFLRWKYNLETPPPETRPKTLEDVKREDDLVAKARKGQLVEKTAKEAPPKGPGLRTFNVFVDEEYYRVEVEPEGGSVVLPASTAADQSVSPAPARRAEPAPKVEAPPGAVAEKGAIPAPMPGIVLRYLVEVGQKVDSGAPVVVLEAMKMENTIPSPTKGAVKSLNCSPGDKINKGDILAVVA